MVVPYVPYGKHGNPVRPVRESKNKSLLMLLSGKGIHNGCLFQYLEIGRNEAISKDAKTENTIILRFFV